MKNERHRCDIIQSQNLNSHMCRDEAETHSACSAQRQVVHLLGERRHDTGGVKRQTRLYGRRWGDHSTLWRRGKYVLCIMDAVVLYSVSKQVV